MNPFLLSPEERLTSWKELRESLTGLSEHDQLQAVADYWAEAPLMKVAYDPDCIEEWPSPWEMVSEGDWCRFSVAVGMEATLRLAGWDKDRLQILSIRDYDISEQMCVLKIDDGLILNYTVGLITEYPKTKHDILVRYKSDGKRYFLLHK